MSEPTELQHKYITNRPHFHHKTSTSIQIYSSRICIVNWPWPYLLIPIYVVSEGHFVCPGERAESSEIDVTAAGLVARLLYHQVVAECQLTVLQQQHKETYISNYLKQY